MADTQDGMTSSPAAPDPDDTSEKGDVRSFARYCAKMSDMLLFSLPYLAIMFMVGAVLGAVAVSSGNEVLFDWISGTGQTTAIFWGVVAWALALFLFPLVEASIISAFGTTPGKALMGIRVLGEDGGKLGFGASYSRSLQSYIVGLGAGIPLVSFVAGIVAFMNLTRNGEVSWDGPVNYRTRPVNPLRWGVGILLVIANIAANIADRVWAEF